MLFGIITGLTGIALTVIAVMLYRGRTDLVHSYHRSHVKDHAGYGQAMGKATGVLAGFLLVSSVLAFALPQDKVILYALALTVIGLLVYSLLVIAAQKRFNRIP